jgi:hypothetical protein
MNEETLKRYVDAACAAQRLALSSERRDAVVEQFARIAQIAETFLDFPLGPEDEQAPVYRP